MINRDGGWGAVSAFLETRAQIILAHIVGGDIAAEQGGFAGVMNELPAGQSANQRHYE